MQKYSKNASSGAINLGWHSFRLGFLKVLFLSCPHMQIPYQELIINFEIIDILIHRRAKCIK